MPKKIIAKSRKWLSQKLQNGLWYPQFIKSLQWLYKKFSLGFRFKTCLRNGGRNPSGASELYQLVWLILGLAWLMMIRNSVALMSGPMIQFSGIVICSYRLGEIFVFTLHWIFAAEGEKLHDTRRSLALFFLNLIELAIYVAIIFVLRHCLAYEQSQWNLALDIFGASFSFSPMESIRSGYCSAVDFGRVVLASLLISVAIASLIGGVLREEKSRSE